MESDRKLIGQAKRMWTNSKKETIYTDSMSDDEVLIINSDEELAIMIAERKKIEQDIIKRIDHKLAKYRQLKINRQKQLAEMEE